MIDDDPLLRKLMERHFSTKGYTTRTAENGERALELLKEWHPDLILCDINMPVMDGYETLQRIRAIPDYANIPVVMLSAQSSPDYRVRARRLGATGYIVKNHRFASLTDEVLAYIPQTPAAL
jgi:CheY-like chemotaxis protein